MSAKDTKIFILILMPLFEEVNADECKNSLKRALNAKVQGLPLEENANNSQIKQIFTISNGVAGLKQNPKQLMKALIDNMNTYYSTKKRDNKAKQKKLINKEQTENVRYSFKIGIYSQLSKGDVPTSLKYMKEAYESIKASLTSSRVETKQTLDERRDNADIICLQTLVYLLDLKKYEEFIRTYQLHFHLFKTNFDPT